MDRPALSFLPLSLIIAMLAGTLFSLLTLSLAQNVAASSSSSSSYTLQNFYAGEDFYDPNAWTWEDFDDPTHGRVNYVDMETAKERDLTCVEGDTFLMGADSINLVPPASRGRDSVRISSHATFDYGLVILDLAHMPTGCGTWPAFWTLSKVGPWPNGGEVDIIEGVHKAINNLASLHTSPDCSMPQSRSQTGQTVSTDCDANHNFNQGCGTLFTETTTSYGSGFNAAGGGFYAMEKTRDSINIWYWSRYDPNVPDDVKVACRDEDHTITTTLWGVPNAMFPFGTNCDYADHFDAHQIVFDLTFCGDWAGNVWADSGCANSTWPTCDSFVNNNPSAFEEAYWEINSLRIYVPSY